jgi:hypothetical protein
VTIVHIARLTCLLIAKVTAAFIRIVPACQAVMTISPDRVLPVCQTGLGSPLPVFFGRSRADGLSPEVLLPKGKRREVIYASSLISGFVLPKLGSKQIGIVTRTKVVSNYESSRQRVSRAQG